MTLVSVCMTTASRDRPMLHRQDSIYDILRISLAKQTYKGPVEVIVADTDVSRLAREFAAPWGVMERVILTRQVLHDRVAIAAARNTAAAYARGELLVFVDDCTELLPTFLEAAVEQHAKGKIPTRLLLIAGASMPLTRTLDTRSLLQQGMVEEHFSYVDPVWRACGAPLDGSTWTLSGQAGGVFVSPASSFLSVNGFDENFDGNRGCEDIEFWTRFDRLRLSRVGSCDLAVLRWEHQDPPSRGTLRRCREAYAQWAYQSPRLVANQVLSKDSLEALRGAAPCEPTCNLCTALDREGQIATYLEFPAVFDLRALRAFYSARPSGIYFDPWR